MRPGSPQSSSIRLSTRWVLVLALATIAVAAPAAAADRFSDVAPSSTHGQAIGALVDSGVTAGCAEGRFCPRDVVSREQMASFLVRAMPRIASESSVATLSAANSYSGVPAAVTVRAAGASGGTGTVVLQGSVSVLAEGSLASCPCEVEAFVYRASDDAQGPSSWSQLPGEASGSGRAATALPVSWSVTIPSGTTETFRLAVFINDGSPSGARAEATLTATATPGS